MSDLTYDVNGDGTVDESDAERLGLLLEYDSAGPEYDYNDDGTTDVLDVQWLAANAGSLSPVSSQPSPSEPTQPGGTQEDVLDGGSGSSGDTEADSSMVDIGAVDTDGDGSIGVLEIQSAVADGVLTQEQGAAAFQLGGDAAFFESSTGDGSEVTGPAETSPFGGDTDQGSRGLLLAALAAVAAVVLGVLS